MRKLTMADIAEYEKNKNNAIEGAIVNRIDYIIIAIYSIFGKECKNWYFDGAEEGEIGPIPDLNYDCIDGLICSPEHNKFHIKLNNGEIIKDIIGNFPKQWLFEDFEEELNDGAKRYKIWIIEEGKKHKKQKAARAQYNKIMLDSIRRKLTTEEIKFLKRKYKEI